MTETDIAKRAKFEIIRYAQAWEDADILAAALRVKPSDTVVSIASAGDNALALLAEGAEPLRHLRVLLGELLEPSLHLGPGILGLSELALEVADLRLGGVELLLGGTAAGRHEQGDE